MEQLWIPGILLLLSPVLLSPRVAWELRKPFLVTNQVQWFLASPLRDWYKNPRSGWSRRVYLVLFPLLFIYTVLSYLLLAPLRLINALYFDLLLFWSVSLRDGFADLFLPSCPKLSFRDRAWWWIARFPQRIVRFFYRNAQVIFQGVAMTGFDLMVPTLTLFHGTDRGIAERIAGTGEWQAGGGDYAGTGIYFGLDYRVAEHYSRSKSKPIIVVSRVTLAPCRPISTLPRNVRREIGGSGDAISRAVQFPWASLEHWRTDGSWYEFCLVQPAKFRPVSPWRIRPICIAGPRLPERIVGGLAVWPKSERGWKVLAGAYVALAVLGTASTLSIRSAGWFSPEMEDSAQAPLNQQEFRASALPVIQEVLQMGKADSCPNAPPLRIEIGQAACVADLGGLPLMLRSQPGIGAQTEIASLYEGERLIVKDGPVCKDGYTWWEASVESGLQGWAAEGSPDTYFLEPCP